MKEGWVRVSLDEIATEMYRGSGIKRDQVISEGFPCVRYGEIYTSYNIAFNRCISHTIESEIASKKYFEKGDILFAITGESVEDIGKSIAYLGDEKCLAGGDIVVMKHNQNAKFISYALSTKDAIKQKGFGKTKLKVVHTNVPSLKAIEINIPQSLSEQQRIVTYLDSSFSKIDELKENVAKELSDAKALFQAELKKCMEKKEGWEEKKLGEISSFRNGIGHEKDIDKTEGKFTVINSKFVSSNGCVRKYCGEQKSPLYKGEIVMVMSDVPKGKTLAKCFMIDADNRYSLNQRICAFYNHKVDSNYLMFFLNRNLYFLAFDNGENQTNLRKDDILNCPVFFPKSKDEQHQIVTHLDTLSQKIQELEKNYNTILAECDALKQAILRETFE